MTVTTIPREAALPVHAANAVTGEVPYWDAATGTLWWIDVQGQRLLGFRPADAGTLCFNLPSMPGLIAGCRRGGLVIGLEDGLYAFDQSAGLGERLVAVEAEDTRTRVNDGKPDAAGRLWFGTMDKTGGGAPIGSLYCLDPEGTLRCVRQEVRIANGISVSNDGRTLYFTDTPTNIVEAIPLDRVTGALGEPRCFVAVPKGGHADGTCVDADDMVWIAMVGLGRIERRRPDGTLDLVVELPVTRPTMPMLGGADGRTLFITSQRRFLTAGQLRDQPLSGDLLAVRVSATARSPFLAAI
ncbi:SMP-30/gluconolactonase/LRE family protein [Falsiroseomonas sp. HW251]|uniref:SMP-30/gluconolactonase/LRE family protein n=1 Tax=Falsiroseomonas sp. HW251 TaxID=3390998 RepID=UPI003D31D372